MPGSTPRSLREMEAVTVSARTQQTISRVISVFVFIPAVDGHGHSLSASAGANERATLHFSFDFYSCLHNHDPHPSTTDESMFLTRFI